MDELLKELKYGTKATYALICVNLVVFISTFFQVNNSIYPAILFGGSNLLYVLSGELWRLVTSTFLHLTIPHFLMNMIALYYYGRFIEQYYSGKKLMIIYVISGIGGSVLALLDFSNIIPTTLGASGAIYGLIGVIIGSSIRSNTFSPGLPVNLREFLPPTIVLLFLGAFIKEISFLAHLGGIITGIVLGMIFDTVNTFRPNRFEEKIITPLFFTSVIIVIISFISLIIFQFSLSS